MKRLLRLIPILWIAIVVTMLTSCEEESITKLVGQSLYVLVEDPYPALDFPDTARTIITIALLDGTNIPMIGEEVSVTLSDTNQRWIRLAYPHDEYVTDERGELRFWFEATSQNLGDTLTISAAGMSAIRIIHVGIPQDEPPDLTIWLSRDTVQISEGTEDSVYLYIVLRDNWMPMEGYQVYLSSNGGTLDPLPETDSTGLAFTWWHTNNGYGRFHIVAYGLELTDTAWVTVLPPQPGALQILLGADTIYFPPGDTASTTVTEILTDQAGNVLSGWAIETNLANPQLGFLEFLNPELRDTTNEFGRVEMLYHVWAPGVNYIMATCGGRFDTAMVVAQHP